MNDLELQVLRLIRSEPITTQAIGLALRGGSAETCKNWARKRVRRLVALEMIELIATGYRLTVLGKQTAMRDTESEPLIWLDMDGVVCDLEGFVITKMSRNPEDFPERVFGIPELFEKRGDFWKVVEDYGWTETFANLQWTSWGKTVLAVCRKYARVKFLTSAPNDKAKTGKLIWVNQNTDLSPADDVVFESDKWKYALPGTVLIDDRIEVVAPFIEHGGLGISFPRRLLSARGYVSDEGGSLSPFEQDVRDGVAAAKARMGNDTQDT